jgi:hypothetical protein
MIQYQQSVQEKFGQDQFEQDLLLHLMLGKDGQTDVETNGEVDADEFTIRPLGRVGSAEVVALLIVRRRAAGAV